MYIGSGVASRWLCRKAKFLFFSHGENKAETVAAWDCFQHPTVNPWLVQASVNSPHSSWEVRVGLYLLLCCSLHSPRGFMEWNDRTLVLVSFSFCFSLLCLVSHCSLFPSVPYAYLTFPKCFTIFNEHCLSLYHTSLASVLYIIVQQNFFYPWWRNGSAKAWSIGFNTINSNF